LASTAFADVKIKSRQTMSGQTTENATYIKGKRSRTEMMNGMMVSITMCDLGRDLQLNPQTKTYMVNLYDDDSVGEPTPISTAGKSLPVTKGGTMYITTTIKDTGERRQMFGFTARHIIQTVETESSPDSCNPTKSKMEMDMWVIDAEFGLACTQERSYRSTGGGKSGGCRDKIVPKTIGSAKSGYPLIQKMTMFDDKGKETYAMTQEVVELSKATLDQSLFEAPSDYREAKDATQMYAGGSSGTSYTGDGGPGSGNGSGYSSSSSSAISSNIRNAASKTDNSSAVVGAKTPGTVRIGVAIKTTAVGEGISANDLSAAVQNTLGQYLKGTKVEIVPLEAKLVTAQAGEAKEKECDYVLQINAAHKKGGGGFGFGKMLAQTIGQTGIGHTGSAVGNIAGQMATTAIVTAGNLSGSVKNKDELTLDLKLQSTIDNSSPLARQFKAKAKADGDDIISAIIEQTAQAILDTVGK
ncbi:MAG: hypothetical protein ABL952_16840, partial [Pyrinomonadaceae bacterium]